jgi:two-component system, response regulator PdtaR
MPTVLIVENDPITAMDEQAVLIQAGHTVIGTVSTYERAVQIASEHRPDVALVDYRLESTRDGVTVARHLRRLGTKVIYVTGFISDVRLVDPTAEILPKPFSPEALLHAVEQLASDEG